MYGVTYKSSVIRKASKSMATFVTAYFSGVHSVVKGGFLPVFLQPKESCDFTIDTRQSSTAAPSPPVLV